MLPIRRCLLSGPSILLTKTGFADKLTAGLRFDIHAIGAVIGDGHLRSAKQYHWISSVFHLAVTTTAYFEIQQIKVMVKGIASRK